MRTYFEITIALPEKTLSDILVAELNEIGFEGFEEGNALLKAFIEKEQFQEDTLEEIVQKYHLTFSIQAIADKNWNEIWETGFDPVVVNDFCSIRASFHPPVTGTAYEIIITPKMSFGTGHHATTWLMISAMEKIVIQNKTIMDFGTGTGVLAILADKLGASAIAAIDNDEWSLQNAVENFEMNNCRPIQLYSNNSIQSIDKYDIILANINKNVILNNLGAMKQHLNVAGVLLVSGLLSGDKQDIIIAAANTGFDLKEITEKDGWMCINFAVKD